MLMHSYNCESLSCVFDVFRAGKSPTCVASVDWASVCVVNLEVMLAVSGELQPPMVINRKLGCTARAAYANDEKL